MKKLWYMIATLLLFVGCSKKEDRFPKIDPTETSENTNEPEEISNIDSGDNSEVETPENSENQPANLDDITSGFETLISQYSFEGAQVAITRDSKLVYLESFGKADLEDNNLVKDNSQFRIGSVSKPITLLAISKLVSENKLKLEDRVFGPNSILGEVYGTPPYEANEELITVSNLIDHRGGFTNNPSDIMFDDISLTQSELIGKVLDERSLTYEPGATYEYSNFGYSLLGRIIEKASGENYESYIKEKILAPMGIFNMAIGGSTAAEALANEVRYYSTWSSPYDLNIPRLDATDGWVASAKSLALLAIFSDGNTTVPDLLNPNDAVGYLIHGSWRQDGALPGTVSVMNVGYPTSYIVLLNIGNANYGDTIRTIRNFMNDKIEDINEWPIENLFDTQ